MRLVFLTFCLTGFCFAAMAQTPPQPSGLPVPRFATLKFDRVFARTGPDQTYPIAWIYQRPGLPVEIVQEYNDWRRIKDIDGGEGWVHKIQLSAKRGAMVTGAAAVALTEGDDADSAIVARLQPRVVARLEKCNEISCKVAGDTYNGWVPRTSLWGIYPHEDLH